MGSWLQDARRDVAHALRLLRRAPGFGVSVIVILALGIGASTAIFSVVNALLLKPLPYAGAERFVRLMERPGADDSLAVRPAAVTRTELDEIRRDASMVSNLGAYLPVTMTLSGRGPAVRLDGLKLSPAVFDMLNARPAMGRRFSLGEEAHGRDRVVILSDRLWRRQFNREDVIGQAMLLDGVQHTVVGVMPPRFEFPDAAVEFWLPLAWPAAARLTVVGQLRPTADNRAANDEVTIAMRRARLDPTMRAIARGGPPPPPPPPPPGMSPEEAAKRRPPPFAGSRIDPSEFRWVPFTDQATAPMRAPLRVVSVAVALLMIVACVNVAILLLARSASRAREVALRVALGARRGRVLRQLLTESLVLAAIGGALGQLLALGSLSAIRTLALAASHGDQRFRFGVPRAAEIGFDWTSSGVALALSIGCGLAIGIGTALRQSQADGLGALRSATPGGGGFDLLRADRWRGLLIVAQVAISIVLCVAGSLLVRSFITLMRVDSGYQPDQVLTFRVVAPPERSTLNFHDMLRARLATLPGVGAAGFADELPMSFRKGMVPLTPMAAAGAPPAPGPAGAGSGTSFPILRVVSPGFLDAVGVRIIAGRGFDDRPSAMPSMIVNDFIVRSGVLGEAPVDRVVRTGTIDAVHVVGVAANTREFGLDQESGAEVFMTFRSLAAGERLTETSPPYYAVRTVGDPTAMAAAIRAVVSDLEPLATVDQVRPLADVLAATLTRPRIFAVLLAVFAVIAALVAVAGVAGVVAFGISQRAHEIGVRRALGATWSDVLRLVLGQTLVLSAAGVITGLALAAWSARYLQSILFRVSPLDPATFAIVAIAFSLVALTAVLVAGRRALQVDALTALRQE